MKSPLDSRQLLAFSILARVGSFKVAAGQLCISSSAVSHSIRELEERVGCQLLDRQRKRVVLTQAGEQLLHHCDKILQEMSLAQTSIEHLGKWGRERLRICASHTICQYALPAIVQALSKVYPQIRLLIEQADAPEAVALLRANRVDCAITLEPRSEELLDFDPLFTDTLQFLVGPAHPWAKIGHVVRPEIHEQRYILYHSASSTGRMITDYFADEQVVLDTVIEAGNMETVKELVKRGLGISIVAPWVAAPEVGRGDALCFPLGAKKLKRTWGLLHWRGRPFTLAEETFAGLCRSTLDQFSEVSLALHSAPSRGSSAR
jgi:DNA-binding transcriptional LysR family regulator